MQYSQIHANIILVENEKVMFDVLDQVQAPFLLPFNLNESKFRFRRNCHMPRLSTHRYTGRPDTGLSANSRGSWCDCCLRHYSHCILASSTHRSEQALLHLITISCLLGNFLFLLYFSKLAKEQPQLKIFYKKKTWINFTGWHLSLFLASNKIFVILITL